jgi:multidrug resistance protein, MATE family
MLRLAVPVVTVQVGMMAMGVVDTIMVGHISAQALAAVALGNLYFFSLAVFAMGTLMVLDPVVAQAVGAGDRPAIARAVQRGVLMAGLLTLPAALLLTLAAPVFALARQPAEVVPLAAAYALRSVPGTFPFLLFIVFRQSLQAMGRTVPIVAAIVAANLANAALNWVLIFGHLAFRQWAWWVRLGPHRSAGLCSSSYCGSPLDASLRRYSHRSAVRSGSSLLSGACFGWVSQSEPNTSWSSELLH